MPQNVLLIQGNASDAQIVRDSLSRSSDNNFNVEWVSTCALGLQRLAAVGKQKAGDTTGISAVLVDLLLPDVAGIETFDRLFAAIPQIPIVILSSLQDAAAATMAIQRGAQDFLLKERLDDYVLPKTLTAVIDRAAIAEALFIEKERAQVTLNSIGDAVVCTDLEGHLSYLNIAAERLTGWRTEGAIGRPLEDVVKIIDSDTRAAVPNPMSIATQQNKIVGLPPACVLMTRRTAACDRAARTGVVLPTHCVRGDWVHRRGRGPNSVAAPDLRIHTSRAIHLDSRRIGLDRVDRSMGAAGGVPTGQCLAPEGPHMAQAGGQHFGGGTALQGIHGRRGRDFGRD
jgi:DNA-binding NarL/FixJ family response regulator